MKNMETYKDLINADWDILRFNMVEKEIGHYWIIK